MSGDVVARARDFLSEVHDARCPNCSHELFGPDDYRELMVGLLAILDDQDHNPNECDRNDLMIRFMKRGAEVEKLRGVVESIRKVVADYSPSAAAPILAVIERAGIEP